MVQKFPKRLPTFFIALVLSLIMSGIPQAAVARPLPVTLLFLALQLRALGVIPPIEKEIKLTPRQRQQLQALGQQALTEVNSVLTQAQRSRLAHELRASAQQMRSNKRVSSIVEALKLTPNQRARLQAIAQTSRQKIQAILAQQQSQ